MSNFPRTSPRTFHQSIGGMIKFLKYIFKLDIERNCMTVYVRTNNGKTIRFKCYKKQKQQYRRKLKEKHQSHEA